jgi:hypothetical protein
LTFLKKSESYDERIICPFDPGISIPAVRASEARKILI